MASRIRASHRYDSVPWASSVMRAVEADIQCALQCDLNVLITGEPGLRKSSIAHRIHRESGRAAAPLVRLRMSDAPEPPASLDEAFDWARPDGTVLLQRADMMSPSVQCHLQRRMENGAAHQRRARTSAQRGVRVLTTASSDLFELVLQGRFDDRLFYYLNTVHLRIPPLRDHPEDIPVLLHHFLRLYGQAPVPHISMATRQRLVSHTWPGNVCELRAIAWRLAHDVSRPYLRPDDLPPGIGR